MAKLVVACPDQCSFHPDKIGPGATAALLAIRENGAGQLIFKRRAEQVLGHPVVASSVSRHLKHYKHAEDPSAPPPVGGPKPGDLEILDRIIQRGFENSGTWKPTIKDTIEAMKLKMQMTGNSAFDDLISLFDGDEADAVMREAGYGDEEVEEVENVEAVLSEDERVPEPLL